MSLRRISQKGYYGQIFLIHTDYDSIFFIWKSRSPHEFFISGLKDHERCYVRDHELLILHH